MNVTKIADRVLVRPPLNDCLEIFLRKLHGSARLVVRSCVAAAVYISIPTQETTTKLLISFVAM